MAASAAIAFIGTKIFNYFNNLANAQENAIEKGAETASAFQQQKTSLDSMADTLEKSGERFVELGQGVDQFGNNVSLSSAEFEEYNVLAKEMAETLPNLVTGYTELGTPIISAKNSVEGLNEALAEQKRLLNDEMISKAKDYTESFNAKYNNNGAGFGEEAGLKQQKERLRGFMDILQETGNVQKASEKLNSILFEQGDFAGFGDAERVLKEVEEELGVEFINNFTGKIDEKALKDNIPLIIDYINDIDRQTQAAISEMKPLLQAYLENSTGFSGLSDDTKTAISSIVSSIDEEFVNANFIDENGNANKSFIKKWANGLTKDLNDVDVQDKFSRLFEIDSKKTHMTFKNYKTEMGSLINEVANSVDGLSEEHLSKMFNFNKEGLADFKSSYETVFSAIGTNVDKLSLEDLELGKLIVEDGFTGTFDDFMDKLALAKQAKVDLNATPLMDEYEVAKESKNAGDNYLKMLKEYEEIKKAHKAGEVGTDEYKAFAKWLSPTGADDPKNFQENMPTFEKYFTENSKGAQRFLNDLKKIGKADIVNGKWKYQIDDLEETAKELNMGLEPMLAIFGRLNDYGFSNNFVSSLEQGKEHLTDLYGQLVESEARLKELQSTNKNGLNDHAIEAEKQKIEELKASITDTNTAMTALSKKSAENYAKEVASTKEAIRSLKKERDKILADRTYGKDTDSVVAMMDAQIEEWAAEKNIQLDAELNIVEEKTTVNGKKVDLTKRPQVSGKQMLDAGWKEFEDRKDDTATVYTSSFSNEKGNKTILFTPILPNGDVLSPEALEEYANGVLEGGQDTQGLVIESFYGEESIQNADKYAEVLHLVQEAFYSGDVVQKEALDSLKEYSSEQLKAIDLSDEQTNSMENAFVSLMNSLDISKESASQFIEVLSAMGLIKVDTTELDKIIAKGKEASEIRIPFTEETYKVNLNSNDVEQLESDLKNVLINRDLLNKNKLVLDCDPSELEAADNLVLALIAKIAKANEQSFIMNVDTSKLDEAGVKLVNKVQEFQSAWNSFNFLDQKQKAGFEVDSTQLVQARDEAEKLREEVAKLAEENPDLATSLHLEPGTVDSLQASIKAITPEVYLAATDETYAAFLSAEKKIEEFNKLKPHVDIEASDKATSKINSVDKKLKDLDGNSATTYINTVYTSTQGEIGGTGAGNYQGTAHAYGTLSSKGLSKVTGGLYPVPQLSARALALGSLSQSAYANGSDWTTKKDEVALTGELGQELVVYGNRYWTVGDNGAEFAKIPKGSIVFNHKQTEEIFKNGRINSRGQAYQNGTLPSTGTAYSISSGAGGGMFWDSSTNSYSSIHNYKNKNDKSKKLSDKAKKAAEDALKKITDFFDWIAVNYDRLARNSKLAEDAIERAVGLKAKQSATSNTISKVQTEQDAAKKGAQRYLTHANWFAKESGLSSDLQKKVQSGTIDITKYDEDTQKKISEYKKWYDLYLDSLDKVIELQDKERELALLRLENIEEFYDAVNSVHKSIQDLNESSLELNDAKGFSAVSDTVRNTLVSSMEEAQEIYNNSVKQFNDYQAEFNSLVAQGYLKQGSDEYLEAQAQLNEFKKAVNESSISLIEFQDRIREIEYTKIQNIIDGFERSMSKLDKWIALQESRDEKIPESVYQEQLDTNNSQILANKELRDKKLNEQSLYDVNSKRYQELAKEINALDESTLDLLADNEALKDSIFELRFADLDKTIEQYSKLSDELSSFYDLLNEDAFFTKTGEGTAELAAGLALLQQQLGVNKQKIADYKVGLDKLEESYRNGVISEKEYIEKSEEYRDGIQDTVKANEDLKDSITDLYMTQMKTEVDYLDEIIDKRSEALDKKNQYYEYDKKIKSQSKDVNMLKAEIAALEGVQNATAQAELKLKQQELAEAQEALDETKRQHSIDMQQEGYNKMSEDMHTMLEDVEYELAHSTEKQEEIISSMLNRVVSNYASAYDKINQIIGNTGWIGSGDFNQNQSELGTSGGASSQVDNALKNPSNTKPSRPASGVVTDPIKDNGSINSGIEDTIMQKPNTENRLCAELKLDKSSVSLMEGKSTSVSASIRPTDAKNKTLKWISSNSKVATVSGGTIRAISPGSCVITASTTDGSGLSATVSVTVTKKPEPPKPQPKPPTNNNNNNVSSGGGDGKPNVGDAVTFMSGRYYNSSDGMSPVGNKYLGKTVYITKINNKSWATKPYHIASDKAGKHPLGWVTLKQLRGFKIGAKSIEKEQWGWMDEGKDGKSAPETIIRRSDGAILTRYKPKDGVLTNENTENIFKWAKISPDKFFGNNKNALTPALPTSNNEQNLTVNLNYENLLNIDKGATITKDSIPQLGEFLKKSCDYTTQHIFTELKKAGFRKW